MNIRKFLCVLMVLFLMVAMFGCGATRTVTCDGCGTQITVKEDSNVTDEWILFCKTCEAEMGEIVPVE